MVQRLEALGRSWTLHYAARSRADMAFLETLETMTKARFHFDEESAGKFLDVAALVAEAPKDAHLYCCGPTPMLNAFEAATADWPREQVHIEYFTPSVARQERWLRGRTGALGPGIRHPGRSDDPPGPARCGRGRRLFVRARHLRGVRAAGDFGRTRTPRAILTEEEQASNTKVMICCAGCKSERLVLDL